MIIYTLIDYDNIKPYRQETTIYDVQANIVSITKSVIDFCSNSLKDKGDINIRLYGGWIDEVGHYSQLGNWLLSSLGMIRGLINHWRVIPSLVTSIAVLPGETLLGTLRTHQPRLKQKMVDSMLAVDSIYFANQTTSHLLLISDDDDMVPPVLASRMLSVNNLFVIRKRANGTAINDNLCNRYGIYYNQYGGVI